MDVDGRGDVNNSWIDGWIVHLLTMNVETKATIKNQDAGNTTHEKSQENRVQRTRRKCTRVHGSHYWRIINWFTYMLLLLLLLMSICCRKDDAIVTIE
jgi:hypothetical protein